MGSEQAVDALAARDEAAKADEPQEYRPIEEMSAVEKMDEILEIRAASKGLVNELSQYPLPPMSLQAQRMEMFIEYVMPMDVKGDPNEERVDFELLWERRANGLLAEFLANVEAAATRQKLTGGVNMPMPPPPGGGSGIVLPGQ